MPGLIPICCHPLVASKHPPEYLRGAFKAHWSWLTLVESHQEAFSCCSVLHFTKPNTIQFACNALGVEGLASSGRFLRLVAVITIHTATALHWERWFGCCVHCVHWYH